MTGSPDDPIPTGPPTPEERDLAERWRRLEVLDTLTNHRWWRPGWRVGRSFYTWHLTFDDHPQVADLARRWQAGIDLAGLDHIPADGLHLTMQGIGFTDEVPPDDLAARSDVPTGATWDRHRQSITSVLSSWGVLDGPGTPRSRN